MSGGTEGEFYILIQLFDKGIQPEFNPTLAVRSWSITGPYDPRVVEAFINQAEQDMIIKMFGDPDAQDANDFQTRADWKNTTRENLQNALRVVASDPTESDSFPLVDHNDVRDITRFFISVTTFESYEAVGPMPNTVAAPAAAPAPAAAGILVQAAPNAVGGTGESPRRARRNRKTRRQKLRRRRA
jgi:hypothetical protein